MADLSRQERGQILLVAALALAVTFVALALILNSAIFTENLASRGDTTGGGDVLEYRDELQRGAGTVLTFENKNRSGTEGWPTIRSRVDLGVDNLSSILTRKWARFGASTDTSVAGETQGSRIFQNDATRNFTDANANANWLVVGNVDETRAFRLNVSRSGLSDLGCGLLSGCFVVEVSEGTDSWRVSVAKDIGNNEIDVEVDNGTGPPQACSTGSKPFVEIDLTAGTVGGEPCPALSFSEAPDNDYEIYFENAKQIEGTYNLVTDNTSVSTSPIPAHYGPSPGPAVSKALYAVTLDYDFVSPYVTVNSTVRVAPGEPDD